MIVKEDKTPLTKSERQKRYTNKLKAEGYIRFEIWTKPEHKEAIKDYAKKLNE